MTIRHTLIVIAGAAACLSPLLGQSDIDIWRTRPAFSPASQAPSRVWLGLPTHDGAKVDLTLVDYARGVSIEDQPPVASLTLPVHRLGRIIMMGEGLALVSGLEYDPNLTGGRRGWIGLCQYASGAITIVDSTNLGTAVDPSAMCVVGLDTVYSGNIAVVIYDRNNGRLLWAPWEQQPGGVPDAAAFSEVATLSTHPLMADALTSWDSVRLVGRLGRMFDFYRVGKPQKHRFTLDTTSTWSSSTVPYMPGEVLFEDSSEFNNRDAFVIHAQSNFSIHGPSGVVYSGNPTAGPQAIGPISTLRDFPGYMHTVKSSTGRDLARFYPVVRYGSAESYGGVSIGPIAIADRFVVGRRAYQGIYPAGPTSGSMVSGLAIALRDAAGNDPVIVSGGRTLLDYDVIHPFVIDWSKMHRGVGAVLEFGDDPSIEGTVVLCQYWVMLADGSLVVSDIAGTSMQQVSGGAAPSAAGLSSSSASPQSNSYALRMTAGQRHTSISVLEYHSLMHSGLAIRGATATCQAARRALRDFEKSL